MIRLKLTKLDEAVFRLRSQAWRRLMRFADETDLGIMARLLRLRDTPKARRLRAFYSVPRSLLPDDDREPGSDDE